MSSLMESLHFVKGKDPVADAFDNAVTPASDVVSMRGYGSVLFAVHIGVGATGTQTLEVDACDDVVPTNVSKVNFKYRQILSGDTEGAITAGVAGTGFSTTAGSSKIVLVEVQARDLPAGYPFVRLIQTAEPVNSACLGGVLIIMGGQPSRYLEDIKATAIV